MKERIQKEGSSKKKCPLNAGVPKIEKKLAWGPPVIAFLTLRKN